MTYAFRASSALRLSTLGITAACAVALLSPVAAQAVTLSGLKGTGFDHIYGSYAPGGDCAKEPRLTIDDKGFTFRANGRTVTPPRVEYAASFWGQAYEGITAVFYPFLVSDSNFGGLLMFVNDDEKRGVIRFEADLAPGQRADPFQAAFVSARSFTLCRGSAPANTPAPPPAASQAAPVPGIPLEWNNLAANVGKYSGSYARDNIDLFDKGAVAAALKARLGPKIDVLRTNLQVAGPLERQGNYYAISGNAQHQGGIEQAYIMIDPARRSVQVGLWEKGKLTVYAPATGARLPVTSSIKTMLDNSPPETAVALPGTPWEVLPVQGRSPIAHVNAAGSPNIEAFTLFCEGTRPTMAMLLNKPLAGNNLTVTWNFAGRIINIPVVRGNREGTFWQGSLAGSQLLPLLTQQRGTAELRINGRGEGEASLSNATTTLRATMRACARI